MVKKHDDQVIDCASFEDRIQDLMDQRVALNSDPLLLKHSADCESCHQVLSSFQSLEMVLSEALISERFAESDFEMPAVSSFKTSAIHWGVATAIVSLAAMLLVAFVPIFDQQSNGLMVADNASSSLPVVVNPSKNLPSADASRGEMINLVSYETIPPSLRNAYQYASELPGIRPIECSVTVTIEAFQKSWKAPEKPKQNEENPDLGRSNSNRGNRIA